MALDQRQLGHGEDQRDRHHAEHLEADPEIRREITPDHFIQHRQRQKEQPPAQGEDAPALVRQPEGAVEDITQQRFAEEKPTEQDGTEHRVDDRRFQLDEEIIMQPQGQRAEHKDHDARHQRHDGQAARQIERHGQRNGNGDHEGGGRQKDRRTKDAERRKGRRDLLAARVEQKEDRQRPQFQRQLQQRRHVLVCRVVRGPFKFHVHSRIKKHPRHAEKQANLLASKIYESYTILSISDFFSTFNDIESSPTTIRRRINSSRDESKDAIPLQK